MKCLYEVFTTMDSPSGVSFVINKKKSETIYEKISAIVSPISKHPCNTDKSPSVHETPVRFRRLTKINEEEVCCTTTRPTSPGFSLSDLPIHSTPPSRVSKVVINNPFENALRSSMHLPAITPSLFTRVVSPIEAEKFSWSIEDLAELHAAEIDEFQVQSDQVDEDRSEDDMQQKIKEFFDKSVVPSPWDSLPMQKWVPLTQGREGSLSPVLGSEPLESESSEPALCPLGELSPLLDEVEEDEDEVMLSRKEAWTQTEMTFPPDISSEVDSVIEDYSMSDETSAEIEQQEEDEEDDDEQKGDEENERKDSEKKDYKEDTERAVEGPALSSTLYNPDPSGHPHTSWSSPCQKLRMNLLSSSLHTPQSCTQTLRSFGTPLGGATLLSPIGLSPIVSTLQHVSVEHMRGNESVEAFWASSMGRDITSIDSGFSTTVSQTDMTLPNVLPKNMEKVLRPFCTFVQEQLEAPEALNSSLQRRRKRLFDEQMSMSTSSIPGDVGYDST